MDKELMEIVRRKHRSTVDRGKLMCSCGDRSPCATIQLVGVLEACRAENERLRNALNQARELYKIVCSAVFVREPESMRELQLDRAKELDNIIAAALQSREEVG